MGATRSADGGTTRLLPLARAPIMSSDGICEATTMRRTAGIENKMCTRVARREKGDRIGCAPLLQLYSAGYTLQLNALGRAGRVSHDPCPMDGKSSCLLRTLGLGSWPPRGGQSLGGLEARPRGCEGSVEDSEAQPGCWGGGGGGGGGSSPDFFCFPLANYLKFLLSLSPIP